MGLQNKIQLLFIAVLTVTFANAQNKPASPAASVTGKINGTTITINYSSPSVKGRVIWGELVPFNKIWRAGANDHHIYSNTCASLRYEQSLICPMKFPAICRPALHGA